VQYQHYALYKPSMKDCKGPTLSHARQLKNYNQPTVIRCRVSARNKISWNMRSSLQNSFLHY